MRKLTMISALAGALIGGALAAPAGSTFELTRPNDPSLDFGYRPPFPLRGRGNRCRPGMPKAGGHAKSKRLAKIAAASRRKNRR